MTGESISTAYLALVRERTALDDRRLLIERAIDGLRPLLPRDIAGEPITIGPVIDAEVPPEIKSAPGVQKESAAWRAAEYGASTARGSSATTEPVAVAPVCGGEEALGPDMALTARNPLDAKVIEAIRSGPDCGRTMMEIVRNRHVAPPQASSAEIKQLQGSVWTVLQRLVQEQRIVKDSRLYRLPRRDER